MSTELDIKERLIYYTSVTIDRILRSFFHNSSAGLWLVIALVTLADVVWLVAWRIGLDLSSLLLPWSTTAGLLVTGVIYTKWRPDPRIAHLCNTVAALIGYVAVGGILSYLMVMLRNPLFDDYLVAVDRALGFDWPTMYAFVKMRPTLHVALKLIYISPSFQLFLVLVVLNYRRQFARSREFLWLFILTSLGCVIISGFLPTAGAFVYFHVPVHEPYVEQFQALRNGTISLLNVQHMQGVVQFPSFHLAMAVLLIYAVRGIRYWFPLMFFFNGAVILATPAIGGHHLSDLIGGMVLTAGAIALAGRAQEQNRLT